MSSSLMKMSLHLNEPSSTWLLGCGENFHSFLPPLFKARLAWLLRTHNEYYWSTRRKASRQTNLSCGTYKKTQKTRSAFASLVLALVRAAAQSKPKRKQMKIQRSNTAGCHSIIQQQKHPLRVSEHSTAWKHAMQEAAGGKWVSFWLENLSEFSMHNEKRRQSGSSEFSSLLFVRTLARILCYIGDDETNYWVCSGEIAMLRAWMCNELSSLSHSWHWLAWYWLSLHSDAPCCLDPSSCHATT